MDDKLIDLLSEMTDEDFYELCQSIDIARDMRELSEGEFGFSEDDFKARMNLTPLELINALNGAFLFNVRHIAVIRTMQEEKIFYEEEEEKDEEKEFIDALTEGTDIPDRMDYSIHDTEPGDDKEEVVRIGGGRALTAEETAEFEYESSTAIEEDGEKYDESPFQLQARLQREYQEKIAREEQEGKREPSDPSIIEFIN